MQLGVTVEMQIVRENADGSGVVEVPIAVTARYERSRTAGGGEGEGQITLEMLRQMAQNFDATNRPVPVGFGDHVEFGDRAGASPAFLDALYVRGESLVAHVYAVPALFGELKAGMWRGFSIEAALNMDWPTGTVEGWSVYGGIFTNRPAIPVNFRRPDAIAASVDIETVDGNRLGRGKEKDMSKNGPASNEATVTLAFHESKVAEQSDLRLAAETEAKQLRLEVETLKGQVAEARKDAGQSVELRDETAALKAKVQRLETESKSHRTAVKELETRLTEANNDLHAERTKNLGIEVKQVIHEAIDAGVAPAFFDGYESDPAEWMESRYASLDAFKEVLSALRGVAPKIPGAGKKAPASGHDPKKASDPGGVQLSEDQQKRMRRMGLDPKFAGIKRESELLDMKAADK